MFHIYSDGSCINNGLPNAIASWSYVVTDDDNNVIEASTGRVSGEQNSNRAELVAFIKTLQHIRNQKDSKFIIYVDFELLYLYCNGKARPKSNLDLFREIDYLLYQCRNKIIEVQKVKAHKTQNSIINFINGFADKLARNSLKLFFGGNNLSG